MIRLTKRRGRKAAGRNNDNYEESGTVNLFEDDEPADLHENGNEDEDEDDAFDGDDNFDEEQFDAEPAPAAHRVSSREVAAMRAKRRKRLLLIAGICAVSIAVLGIAGYFGITLINENRSVDAASAQIAALNDTSAFADLSDYSVATAQARASYNALTAKLRSKVDAAPLDAAEQTITRLTPVQDSINALPTEISFLDIAARTADIAAVRADFDALSEADRQLLDDAPLTAAETLAASAQAEFAPIIDLNARIAAFSISDDATKANIDQATAALAAFRAELAAATYDKTYVDTARLDMLSTQLAALVNSYSTRLSADGPAIIAKLNDAAEQNDRIVRMIREITIVEGNTAAVQFPLSEIERRADEYESLMDDVIALIKGADMFNVIPGYTDAALNSAQRGIDKVAAGVKHGKNTPILDVAGQSAFLDYFTSAARYTSEVSVAVSTVNSELTVYLEGLDAGAAAPEAGSAPEADATPAP